MAWSETRRIVRSFNLRFGERIDGFLWLYMGFALATASLLQVWFLGNVSHRIESLGVVLGTTAVLICLLMPGFLYASRVNAEALRVKCKINEEW